MKQQLFLKILILNILLTALGVQAQQNIIIHNKEIESISIGELVYIFEDQTGRLTIEEILSDSSYYQFLPSESIEPNFGFTSSAYWLRFSIENRSGRKFNSYLEVSYPLLDSLDLYKPISKGQYTVQKTGDHLPFNSRELQNRNFIFSIDADSGSVQTYYLRAATSSSMNLPLTVWSHKEFLTKTEIEQLLLGIFFGSVFLMIIYNIFLFIGFRDKSFVYLFLFIASWGFAQLTINGLAFQYLWSDWTWWSDVNLPFFIFASVWSAVQFCRSLLNTKKNFPKWDKFLLFENYLFVSGLFISLITEYSLSIQLAAGSAIAAVVSVTLTGLAGIKQKNRSALILISAWGLFLLGALLFALKSFGLIPSHFITNWSVQIGFFVMMILLSIAVQDRVEREKIEKHKAQQKLIEALKQSESVLERKAEERTDEINRINILLMDRAIELASINQLTEKVNSSLNLTEILSFASEEIAKLYSVRNAFIALLDSANYKLDLAASFSIDEDISNYPGSEISLSDNEAFRLVVESARPLVIDNIRTDERIKFMKDIFQSKNINKILIIPILAQKKVIGVLGISDSDQGREFSKYEIDLAKTIAFQIASSVQNANQYSETDKAREIAERDLEIGRQIQSGFFPPSIYQVPGWEIAAYFKAARQVAGDYYDVFPVKNSNLTAFVIADVCDKGVGAALFMVLFRSLIRAYSEDSISSDKIQNDMISIIQRMNNYISTTHSKSNMFASVFFGIIDQSNSDIFYINAGHDSPAVLNSTGKILQRLEPTGPVVGMMPEMSFELKQIKLNPGDMLFAYTDGTTDAVNSKGEFFTEEKIIKVVSTYRSSGFSHLFELNSELTKHIGNQNQFDDITQIIIRKKLSDEDNIHTLSRKASMENLEELRNFVEEAAGQLNLSDDVIFALKLSTEEICTNIIKYGYKDMNDGVINISFEHNPEKLILRISDFGKHFPPDEAEVPDSEAELNNRNPGGLGLHLINNLMDKVSYSRGSDNSNILILEKTII